jgi:hypothetical protein
VISYRVQICLLSSHKVVYKKLDAYRITFSDHKYEFIIAILKIANMNNKEGQPIPLEF